MRDVQTTEELEIPEGVDVTVKSRIITVKGPRGSLVKNVRHIDMDIRLVKSKNSTKVTLAVWQGGRKHVACIRTIRSLISNMIKGVTKVRFVRGLQPTAPCSQWIQGFRYKMRAVYAHFPINCIPQDDGAALEIRNFLGEKVRLLSQFMCRNPLTKPYVDRTKREDVGGCNDIRVEGAKG